MATHEELLKIVRQRFTDHIDYGCYIPLDDDRLCRTIFTNYRKNNDQTRGLRLSIIGLSMIQSCFASWRQKMPNDFLIKPKYLIYLDTVCTMPYFLCKTSLILFEAQLAMRAKLVGNLDHLMTAFGSVENH